MSQPPEHLYPQSLAVFLCPWAGVVLSGAEGQNLPWHCPCCSLGSRDIPCPGFCPQDSPAALPSLCLSQGTARQGHLEKPFPREPGCLWAGGVFSGFVRQMEILGEAWRGIPGWLCRIYFTFYPSVKPMSGAALPAAGLSGECRNIGANLTTKEN